MRTTLTLDDDLVGRLKERAQQMGISYKEMVNHVVRAGLGAEANSAPPQAPKTISHSFGFKPGIDLDKINQLADELEADEAAESLRRQ